MGRCQCGGPDCHRDSDLGRPPGNVGRRCVTRAERCARRWSGPGHGRPPPAGSRRPLPRAGVFTDAAAGRLGHPSPFSGAPGRSIFRNLTPCARVVHARRGRAAAGNKTTRGHLARQNPSRSGWRLGPAAPDSVADPEAGCPTQRQAAGTRPGGTRPPRWAPLDGGDAFAFSLAIRGTPFISTRGGGPRRTLREPRSPTLQWVWSCKRRGLAGRCAARTRVPAVFSPRESTIRDG